MKIYQISVALTRNGFKSVKAEYDAQETPKTFRWIGHRVRKHELMKPIAVESKYLNFNFYAYCTHEQLSDTYKVLFNTIRQKAGKVDEEWQAMRYHINKFDNILIQN